MALNGSVDWGKEPLWFSGDDMNDQQQNFNGGYLMPVGNPIIYQIAWASSGVTDQYTPTADGDLVNTLFHIDVTTEYNSSGGTSAYGGWRRIATIKKSRDLAVTDEVTGLVPQKQTFTIDISSILQDELSYSLCPIGQGSWRTNEWGGMNGGAKKQDTVVKDVSPYIVTRNGTFRHVRVYCSFQQLNASGEVVLSSTTKNSANVICVVNSVVETNQNPYYNQMRVIQQWGTADNTPKLAMTNCPNYSINTAEKPSFMKSVSTSDNAEFLQFYIRTTYNGSDDTDYYNQYGAFGVAFNKDGSTGLQFALASNWKDKNGNIQICDDISHDFNKENSTVFAHNQKVTAIQNVSPAYINSHAYAPFEGNYPYTASTITPITSSTGWYRIYLRGFYNANNPSPNPWVSVRHTSVYWYKIDNTERQGAYEKVRFHWLNRAGGIDSYTATKSTTLGLQIEKNIIGTSLPDRRYHQSKTYADGSSIGVGGYYDDSMRGFDTYRGGAEVMSVNASNKNSVYTQPMSYLEGIWFSEIFSSPNVWIQLDADTSTGAQYKHDSPFHMNELNSELRPDKSIYLPVIITNTDVTIVNEEEGLTSYNIEYSESQEMPTQRN